MAHESHPHQQKQGSLISSGFCYPDYPNNNPMQTFEPNPAELFNLQTGMEILGMPSKNSGNNSNLEQRDHRSPTTVWRGFQAKPVYEGSSSSKEFATNTSNDFYQPPEFNNPDHFSTRGFSVTSTENMMGAPETAPWQANRLLVDDSSLRCLFPGVGNDQPNQGLSLSLCNPQQSDVGLQHQQSLELREPSHHHQHEMSHVSANLRDRLYAKAANLQQPFIQDGRFFSSLSSSSSPGLCQQPHSMRSSRYLVPAQELLNEFCSLGSGSNSSGGSKKKFHRSNQWEEGGSSSSSTWNQSLYSLDILEMQKRKAKLLSMLEEVDRRYRKYCDQMRAVVSSFEAVAGEGAATVYSTLASKAMSRHFRCLRDGIVGQIRGIKKAMGEKDPIAPGTSRGETPRLKVLDQCLRQQKAFQQAGVIESHPWRPQRGLPERSVSVLRAWLFEHFLHPYPSDVDKHILARQTGLSRSQVSNWFINARVRLWKPMVEEMYLEETKEHDNQSSHGAAGHDDSRSRPSQIGSSQNPNPNPNPNPNIPPPLPEDHKPLLGQLINDSDSLSSIINSSHNSEGRDPMTSRAAHQPLRHHHQNQQQQQFSRNENFGIMDLDFSSYNDCGQQNFGSGVSLTLGLQQHNGGGMSLSFSPASQHSLFLQREPIDNCQPVQFSILDGDGQNLPYRNLMGTQLLHDLAG